MDMTARLTGGDIFLLLNAWNDNGQPGQAFINGKQAWELRIDDDRSMRFRGLFELDFIPISADDKLEIFYPYKQLGSQPPAPLLD